MLPWYPYVSGCSCWSKSFSPLLHIIWCDKGMTSGSTLAHLQPVDGGPIAIQLALLVHFVLACSYCDASRLCYSRPCLQCRILYTTPSISQSRYSCFDMSFPAFILAGVLESHAYIKPVLQPTQAFAFHNQTDLLSDVAWLISSCYHIEVCLACPRKAMLLFATRRCGETAFGIFIHLRSTSS